MTHPIQVAKIVHETWMLRLTDGHNHADLQLPPPSFRYKIVPITHSCHSNVRHWSQLLIKNSQIQLNLIWILHWPCLVIDICWEFLHRIYIPSNYLNGLLLIQLCSNMFLLIHHTIIPSAYIIFLQDKIRHCSKCNAVSQRAQAL